MVPKILFHGTSYFRWQCIERDKRMRVDLPKRFPSDEKKSAGYLFFTDTMLDAVTYGMSTSMIDMTDIVDPIVRKIAYAGRDIVVVALKTSKMKHRIEVDPDGIDHKRKFTELGKQENNARALEFAKSNWFRVKGDIPIQFMFPYVISPYDQLDESDKATMALGILATDLNEMAIVGEAK
jgi:hypothetical protein